MVALVDVLEMSNFPLFDICLNRHRGSAASIDANPHAEAKRKSHERIKAFARTEGRIWLHSVCRQFNMTPNEASPRLSELKAIGTLVPDGTREEKCAVLVLREDVGLRG